ARLVENTPLFGSEPCRGQGPRRPRIARASKAMSSSTSAVETSNAVSQPRIERFGKDVFAECAEMMWLYFPTPAARLPLLVWLGLMLNCACIWVFHGPQARNQTGDRLVFPIQPTGASFCSALEDEQDCLFAFGGREIRGPFVHAVAPEFVVHAELEHIAVQLINGVVLVAFLFAVGE